MDYGGGAPPQAPVFVEMVLVGSATVGVRVTMIAVGRAVGDADEDVLALLAIE
jgi:hypothetical protein